MSPKTLVALAVLGGIGGIAALLLSPGQPDNDMSAMSGPTNVVQQLDLSGFADAPPAKTLRLLFIHHSCGGQLFASPGTDIGTNCIYVSNPNGGGLRSRLEKNSYEVHQVSYGSRIGQNTDLFDWLPKFRTQMESILTCDTQDTSYTDGRRNQIVAFKSCYPNNAFKAQGTPPGNPAGPELKVWNAKATYTALLEEFKKHPDVLFVCVTAPPLAPKSSPQPLWKIWAKKILGRGNSLATSGPMAREFNNWLTDPNGWLKDYPLKNVVVFDYYHVLTGNGASCFSAYATGNGYDSHPSREGNEQAAAAFVPLLNRAVRRAGLAQ